MIRAQLLQITVGRCGGAAIADHGSQSGPRSIHRHVTMTQIYDKRRRTTSDSAQHDVPIKTYGNQLYSQLTRTLKSIYKQVSDLLHCPDGLPVEELVWQRLVYT